MRSTLLYLLAGFSASSFHVLAAPLHEGVQHASADPHMQELAEVLDAAAAANKGPIELANKLTQPGSIKVDKRQLPGGLSDGLDGTLNKLLDPVKGKLEGGLEKGVENVGEGGLPSADSLPVGNSLPTGALPGAAGLPGLSGLGSKKRQVGNGALDDKALGLNHLLDGVPVDSVPENIGNAQTAGTGNPFMPVDVEPIVSDPVKQKFPTIIKNKRTDVMDITPAIVDGVIGDDNTHIKIDNNVKPLPSLPETPTLPSTKDLGARDLIDPKGIQRAPEALARLKDTLNGGLIGKRDRESRLKKMRKLKKALKAAGDAAQMASKASGGRAGRADQIGKALSQAANKMPSV